MGTTFTSKADANQLLLNSALSEITDPVLLRSSEGVSFVLVTKEYLYIPPESFWTRMHGPFQFSKKIETRAKQIIESGKNTKIHIRDERGNRVNAVDMVLELCSPCESYYTISESNAFLREGELRFVLIHFCEEYRKLGLGEIVFWEQVSRRDLAFINRVLTGN